MHSIQQPLFDTSAPQHTVQRYPSSNVYNNLKPINPEPKHNVVESENPPIFGHSIQHGSLLGDSGCLKPSVVRGMKPNEQATLFYSQQATEHKNITSESSSAATTIASPAKVGEKKISVSLASAPVERQTPEERFLTMLFNAILLILNIVCLYLGVW